MFTGIIEELGEVVAIEPLERASRIAVKGSLVTSDTALGDSIAVNGVCLTVMGIDGNTFWADVMNETLQRSALSHLDVGSAANLERAMAMNDRLGGHIVQGHVDGVGVVTARESTPNWDLVSIQIPQDLRRYIVEKGSITIDGISLTVANLTDDGIVVSLIPTTLKLTTLGSKPIGEQVNLEVDVIAKYVERLVSESGVVGGSRDN